MGYLNDGAGRLREGKRAAAITDVGTLTSAAAAGATPTKVEYDKVVADVAALRAKLNTTLAALRTAGLIA